jgi:Mor family transcriptional regulator
MLATMGHRRSIAADRNRAICAAYDAGIKVEQLSVIYGLSVDTIREIMRQEAHRRALSVDVYYRKLRHKKMR